MDKLDEKSAAKFISALVKSVQALCHGYLDFHNGIEIIGHINLSVDKESSLHYILEEKVCKSEENSTMFISNSFYAQKAEVQTKEKGCENILSGSNTVQRTDPIDVSEVSRVSPAVSEIGSLPSWHEKSQSASTSSANETDLSCKSPPTPAKRKVSCESNVKFKAKASRFISGSGEGVTPPPHRLAISSLEDGKPLRKELQIDGLPENSLLPDGKNKDIVNDLGISLVGSVLEPVGEQTNSDSGRQDDVDSDGDLEVTFIKKEFLDEEQSSCLPENSCRFQHGIGTEQKASSSSAMSDSSGFSASHSHPTAASSTYVPSAHSLDITSTQLYGPSTSCQPHQGTSFGSENKLDYNRQMFVSKTYASVTNNQSQLSLRGSHQTIFGNALGPPEENCHQPLDQNCEPDGQFHQYADPCYQGSRQSRPLFVQSLAADDQQPQSSYSTVTSHHAASQVSASTSQVSAFVAPPQHKKRWMCTMCSARYSYQADLKRHVRVRHMDKPRYRCHLCGMGFGLKDHYAGHMGAHNGVKNYECSWCSRKYFYRSDLMRHSKTCLQKNAGQPKL